MRRNSFRLQIDTTSESPFTGVCYVAPADLNLPVLGWFDKLQLADVPLSTVGHPIRQAPEVWHSVQSSSSLRWVGALLWNQPFGWSQRLKHFFQSKETTVICSITMKNSIAFIYKELSHLFFILFWQHLLRLSRRLMAQHGYRQMSLQVSTQF